MIIDERTGRQEQVLDFARQIMSAGRTAPKGKGIDIIEIITITDETKAKLAETMRSEAVNKGMKFFIRDADNIDLAEAVILIGTQTNTMSLNCGYCGYATCEKKEKHPDVPCAINSVDLGIAIGSMCSVAADLRVDTRVMFSAGFSAHSIGLLTECRSVLAMPLSISSKSPFFDRQSTR